MRIVTAVAGAAFLILVASPALAGEPRGGGGCGHSCGGGGGHRPPPMHPPGGGFNSNINVNVNANATANAFAGASAGSHFNARAYDVGGIRGRGYGGGTVYVGGGYGGDGGGYYGGGAIYNEEIYEGRACASAPFGYVVEGFGRNGRRAPACVDTRVDCRTGDDRGGRYGYSERHSCGGGRRESHDSYETSGSYGRYQSYESREEYREESSYEAGYSYGGYAGGGYYGGGHDCGCDHGGRPPAPYPPVYAPEPPAYHPAPPERPRHPPRQYYSQEPGERG